MNEKIYECTPFSEPVRFKTYLVGDGVMSGELRGKHYLSKSHKIIRRIPNYELDMKNPQNQILDGIQKLRNFGSYPNLHVPNFEVIRGTFGKDDIRFEPYLFIVDEVVGNNLSVKKFRRSEREEAGRVLESFSISFIDFANDLYQNGGFYPSDQLFHQYVYGRTAADVENKVYLVDLDLKFNYFNRKNPETLLAYSGLIVEFIGRLIKYSESVANRSLTNAREGYSKLLNSLFNDPSFASDAKHLIKDVLD